MSGWRSFHWPWVWYLRPRVEFEMTYISWTLIIIIFLFFALIFSSSVSESGPVRWMLFPSCSAISVLFSVFLIRLIDSNYVPACLFFFWQIGCLPFLFVVSYFLVSVDSSGDSSASLFSIINSTFFLLFLCLYGLWQHAFYIFIWRDRIFVLPFSYFSKRKRKNNNLSEKMLSLKFVCRSLIHWAR